MNDSIKNNRNLLIKEWFSNLLSGRNNQNTILLLEDLDGTLESKITRLIPIPKPSANIRYTVFGIGVKIPYQSILNFKNTILITPAKKGSEQFPSLDFSKLFDLKILYVPVDYTDFYFNIPNYINATNQENPTTIQIPYNERHFHFIERVDLHKLLINNRNYLWINEYLNFMLDRYYKFCNEADGHSLLVKGTTFKETTYSNDMKSDVNLFITYNILTSRLAVIIYRIAFLDPNANTTKIGIYFQKNSGSKSKVFSTKTHKALANIPDLKGKSFKAYDFNVNEAEIAIREEIAIKLTELDIKELDAQKIYQITGYPHGGLKS